MSTQSVCCANTSGLDLFCDTIFYECHIHKKLGHYYQQYPVMTRVFATPIALIAGFAKVFLFPLICLVNVVVMPIMALLTENEEKEKTLLQAWSFSILGAMAYGVFLLTLAYHVNLTGSIGIFVGLISVSITIHVYLFVREPVAALDSEPEVELIENESPPPQEIVSKLPGFLQEFAPRIHYLCVPENDRLTFETFKDCDHSLLLYSHQKNQIGIYMKLEVQHRAVDSGYDRSQEVVDLGIELDRSSKQPFSIEVIAHLSREWDGQWRLTAERNTSIEHRNAPYYTFCILDSSIFSFTNDTLPSDRQIERFTRTKKQDDLPDDEREHLAWILLRLLNGLDLEVREWKGNITDNYKNPVLGYWQICLQNSVAS